MADLKRLMRHNYLEYASYVILDRAIPNAIDGLKPVQRRILHTLFVLDDGKLHKVANVVGQTMAFHPHGDGPIGSALVNLANKGYLCDLQGNFGNIYTGDPAAAARYIETRLSSLAKETLFNKAITSYVPSYDGRNQEPVSLPAKIPLVLLQGAEGIDLRCRSRRQPRPAGTDNLDRPDRRRRPGSCRRFRSRGLHPGDRDVHLPGGNSANADRQPVAAALVERAGRHDCRCRRVCSGRVRPAIVGRYGFAECGRHDCRCRRAAANRRDDRGATLRHPVPRDPPPHTTIRPAGLIPCMLRA